MAAYPEKLSEHFSTHEGRCNHCGALPENPQVMINTAAFMEKVRRVLGDRPIRVLSWYRCADWNAQVGGASQSQHLKGYAVDFTVKGLSPRQVQKILKAHFPGLIKGLGRYAGFTHVDRRTGTPATWTG